jgi:hypothetical protein
MRILNLCRNFRYHLGQEATTITVETQQPEAELAPSTPAIVPIPIPIPTSQGNDSAVMVDLAQQIESMKSEISSLREEVYKVESDLAKLEAEPEVVEVAEVVPDPIPVAPVEPKKTRHPIVSLLLGKLPTAR